MRYLFMLLTLVSFTFPVAVSAQTKADKPVLKITPGKVIVPFDRMRRIWGELISVDLKSRTGVFRAESDDVVRTFTVMPYAELLHHAANGDLQDFRVGERAIFRLHENDKGEWVYLTYIQGEMNFYHNHKEFLHVDAIDAKSGRLICTQASADKSYVREKDITIDTDAKTRYWKNGEPAKFADIQIGSKLQTKSRGVGKGKGRVCWDVFLDETSLVKMQAEQKKVHLGRILSEGMPGYVDMVNDKSLELTLFAEGGEVFRKLKVGQTVRIAPAGVDRKPSSEPVTATVAAFKLDRNLGKVSLTLTGSTAAYRVAELARVWIKE